jgi:hypothetical protein
VAQRHRTTAAGTARALVSLAVVVGCTGCTCGSAGVARDGGAPAARARVARAVWLRACIPAPRALLTDLRALVDDAAGRPLPDDPDRLAAHLVGIAPETLAGTVDWDGAAEILLLEARAGRPAIEGLALRLQRHPQDRGRTAATGRRVVQAAGGPVHLEADREHLWLAWDEAALAAARARPGAAAACAPGDESLRGEVAPAFLASEVLTAWVARHGAWLEATARQGTARQGRSEIGDPEAAARALAAWLEATRARLHGAAPLELSALIGPEAARINVVGASPRHQRAAPVRGGGEERFALIAPDAYLVVAERAATASRRDDARAAVDTAFRVAGDRLGGEERGGIEEDATALASSLDGWSIVALRPALEAGPLAGVAVLESPDPTAAAAALDRVARRLTGGLFAGRVLEHLGGRVERVVATEATAEGAGLRFVVAARPAATRDAGAAPGDVLATLAGAAPALAWRQRRGVLLAAFGQDPAAELGRLDEALAHGATPSVLGQPVLRAALAHGGSVDSVVYGWAPAVAGLLTHGGPPPSGLPPGALALTRGTDSAGRPRATLHVDGPQVRSLVRLATSRRPR